MTTTNIDWLSLLSTEHRDFLAQTAIDNRPFAGWFMEADDEGESAEETTTEDDPEGQEPGEGDESTEDDAEGSEEPAEEPASDEVDEESTLDLEGAKKALAKVRKEAASSRTKLRELEQKFAEAKTPEEFQAAVEQLKADNAAEARALLVENVALKHKLPEDLADALRGDTREELEAHAKKLAKYAPVDDSEDPELRGGLDPSGDSDGGFDPEEYARQMRKQRWSR